MWVSPTWAQFALPSLALPCLEILLGGHAFPFSYLFCTYPLCLVDLNRPIGSIRPKCYNNRFSFQSYCTISTAQCYGNSVDEVVQHYGNRYSA